MHVLLDGMLFFFFSDQFLNPQKILYRNVVFFSDQFSK